MIQSGLEKLSGGCTKLCLVAALFWPVSAGAQTHLPGLRHVRWPLLDMVVLPDSSSGLWLLVAPNAWTRQWSKDGSSLVSLGIDPILALQWTTVARRLTGELVIAGNPSVTPPLRSGRGPALVLLARNPRKAPISEAFVFLVSDSASHTQWKAFASPTQVDTLLAAIEAAARERQPSWDPSTKASSGTDNSVDAPVQVIFQPTPKYPGKLASKGSEGRVWMSYAVDSTGRTETGSMRPLLSDDPLFTQAAIEALIHSKFRPALRGGRPVRQTVFQVIAFRRR